MGLKPTLEFERIHTFKSFRQFPELRTSISRIEEVQFRSSDPRSHMKSESFKRKKVLTSTHQLAELSQSSLSEVSSVMDDFRRILIENRRKNQLRPLSPSNRHNNNNPNSSQSRPNSSSSVLPTNGIDGESSLLTTDQTSSVYMQRSQSQPSITDLPRDPLLSANEKLKKISVSFDAGSYNSHLAGFQGAKLTKSEFKTALRRCLNIHLRAAELDALFTKMDADNSMLIDGVEFIRYFFHLGNEAKAHMQRETRDRQLRKLERQKQSKQREEMRIRAWENSQISGFQPEDTIRVLAKLEDAAWRYDPMHDTDHTILHRLKAYLTPYDFQQAVVKTFQAMGMQLHLTGPELAALVDKYSTQPGDRCVNGYAFVTHFVHWSKAAWEKHKQEQVPLRRRRERVTAMGQHTDIMPASLGR